MSLKNLALKGVIWTFLDAFVIRIILFVSMILLARWLGPKEFGLIGMIAVFIAVGRVLTNGGMASSLIRSKKTNLEDYNTVFLTNLLMSVILYFFVFLISSNIADFYKQPVLTNLIRVYSLIFILVALSAVHIAILTKNMDFKKITKINFIALLAGAALGLYLGYNSYGAWSVVWMYILTEIVNAALLWYFSNWKPSFLFSKKKFIIHFNFGYKLMLSSLLNTFYKNIYNILLGKFYDPEILGYYERSKQLSEYPTSALTGVIDKVTYPLLSKIQFDKLRFTYIYRKLIRISFFVIAPIMLGSAAIAEPLFLLILGKEWLPAVEFFQILCLAMMLYPIHSFNLNILKVEGRSDLFLKLEIIKKIISTFYIIFALQFGALGLVWSSVFASYTALFINMRYSSKFIDYTIVNQFKDLVLILIIAAITAALMFKLVDLLSGYFLLLQVFIPSTLGFIFYISLNLINKKSPLYQALDLLKNRNI